MAWPWPLLSAQRTKQHPGHEPLRPAVAAGADGTQHDGDQQAGLERNALVEKADQRIDRQAHQAVDRQ